LFRFPGSKLGHFPTTSLNLLTHFYIRFVLAEGCFGGGEVVVLVVVVVLF